MKRTEWSAPDQVTPAPVASGDLGVPVCDCAWHRRIFTHIALGPATVVSDLRDRQRLPLGRSVIRTDYDDGSIGWQMSIVVEGARFLVFRTVAFGRVRFDAIVDGVTRLAADNDHSRRPEGGDPTLIWALPEQVGKARFPAGSTLIVWPEAWWWHLDSHGRDVLHAAEHIGAVSDDDAPWSLPG